MPKIVKTHNLKPDTFDRAILNLVQVDNKRTHMEIWKIVGLSESAVRRRLAAMRKDGVISRDVSLLDPSIFDVTLIVQVSFCETVPRLMKLLAVK